MSRRKIPEQPPEAEPDGFASRLCLYVDWMKTQHYATDTIAQVEYSVSSLAAWCAERDVDRPAAVTRSILEQYARHLYRLRKPSGEPLSFRTQYGYLSSLRSFFRFLARRNYVLVNPANDLELPKLGRRLPRTVLTHEEAERVLAEPDVSTPPGLRDRALLETMYSTGMRRMEIVKLLVEDLDVERRTVFVRQGKHKKDRLVPIGERALEWNARYLDEVRPRFAVDAEERALYLTEYGKRLSEDGLSHRVSEYVHAAAIEKEGSCHLFRHTAATVMLEGGADVRAIQEILGHAKLDTTMIYTHVSIGHLKRVHAETHPSAKRPEHAGGKEEDPE